MRKVLTEENGIRFSGTTSSSHIRGEGSGGGEAGGEGGLYSDIQMRSKERKNPVCAEERGRVVRGEGEGVGGTTPSAVRFLIGRETRGRYRRREERARIGIGGIVDMRGISQGASERRRARRAGTKEKGKDDRP